MVLRFADLKPTANTHRVLDVASSTACWPAATVAPYPSARVWKVTAAQWDGSSPVIPEGAPNDETGGFLYRPAG